MNCHPDRSEAKWRACPERSRMGTCGSADTSWKGSSRERENDDHRKKEDSRGLRSIKPAGSVVAEGVNHLLHYVSLLINWSGISALVHYPVLVIVVEKEQVLFAGL